MKSKAPEYHLKNLEQLILPAVNILPFDSDAAFTYGKIRVELERKGIPLTHADLQIAAIALINDLVLVTGNIRHFARIDSLKVENWIK
jgi:tRNA(fMet)-specific endonuclease VapC